MNCYEQNVPPVREARLKVGDTFGGGVQELLTCCREGCLLQKNRSFWQAGSCMMNGAMMMAATVEKSAVVVHSPGGCAAQMHFLSFQTSKGMSRRGKPNVPVPWLSTNLTEADVIGGGEQKLRDTIRRADEAFRPEIIFVVNTCAPAIIGDDVEEVVRQARLEVSADVVSLHCPGFKSRVFASAYDMFYHGLLRGLALSPKAWTDYRPIDDNDPAAALKWQQYEYQKAHTVNVWNATSIGSDDEKEIERLLSALGLAVRFYAEYSSRDELRQVSEAALNVSMCDVHDDYILKFLEEKFGTPYVIAGMPVGFRHTREWLLAVARPLGLEKEANALADCEEKLAREAIAPFADIVRGKRVLMYGGAVRVGVEATVMAELGLEVLGIRTYHYDEGADEVFEDVKRVTPKSVVSISTQLFEMTHQVKTLKPDLVIAHNGTQGYMAKLGVVSVQLFDSDKAFFGYAGLYQILRRIAFEFKNTSYRDRLSRHIRLPYRQTYFEGDTFRYIKN
ncbi:MAG: nitrogenase iron-molybdenum protein subunit alpha [Oscillospiraceae bacterium]|jgi:nitrogenase molybdenum-iron protein alpha chain|nr:nitrogenase iron-molybdenum protein subunit alpha [Oscillospiraceae bacterium]